MSALSRIGFLTAALVLAGLTGCGKSGPAPIEKQKTVPVSGVLTYKGKPVPNASVIFQSIDGKVSSWGTTDAAGTFTLTTYASQDGAPPGKYKVTVSAGGPKEIEPGVLADEPPGGFKSPVPVKYASPSTTDVLKDVSESGNNQLTIDLQ
jgi:hypothetical protein